MSKRFYFDEFSEDIFDDEIQQYPSNQTICNILNQQSQRIAELEEQLKKFESIEKEIGCDMEVFWSVYRKISGHENSNELSLYSITDENEIIKIMPTEIISGTYSNYPQDCSFKYWIWDNVKGCYKHTYTYFHFHDYKRYWFLTEEEAQAKLEELQGENR